MGQIKASKADLTGVALRVVFDNECGEEGTSLSITGDFVSQETYDYWTRVRSTRFRETPRLEDLELNVYGSNETGKRQVYYNIGYCLTYRQVYTVHREEAEGMVATFALLERGMDKLRDSDGDALSFGQFVLRICKVLGVKTVVMERAEDDRSYGRYRQMNLAEAQMVLDNRLYQWERRGEEALAAKQAREAQEAQVVPA